MNMQPIENVKSADQARELAFMWSDWESNSALSWGEVSDWQSYFEQLAEKFGLTEEFKENGII